jgi:hypothetical protein
MQAKRERWMELAAQASVEQDPKKVDELVKEIDRLLGEKQDRPSRNPAATKPTK